MQVKSIPFPANVPPLPSQTMIKNKFPQVFFTGDPSPQRDIVQARLRETCQHIGQICEVRFTVSSQRVLVLPDNRNPQSSFLIDLVK